MLNSLSVSVYKSLNLWTIILPALFTTNPEMPDGLDLREIIDFMGMQGCLSIPSQSLGTDQRDHLPELFCIPTCHNKVPVPTRHLQDFNQLMHVLFERLDIGLLNY